MSYAGYRLKVNGTVLPEKYISFGTWSATNQRRKVRSWYDITGHLHEDYIGSAKVTISFSLRGHTEADHAALAAIFSSKADCSVEFWDDDLGGYRTTRCKIDPIRWEHEFLRGGRFVYRECSVKLTEY